MAELSVIGHPILGDFALDMRDSSGRAAHTIIIAGENGCGKTAVLEALHYVLGPAFLGQQMSYDAALILEVDPGMQLPGPVMIGDLGRLDPSAKEVKITVLPRPGEHVAFRRMSRRALDGSWFDDTGPGFVLDRKCWYSEAHVTFAVPSVDSAHAANADTLIPTAGAFPQQQTRGGAELGPKVAQFFADSTLADNEELANWRRMHPQELPPSHIGSRIDRFAAAFAKIFDSKRFLGVERSGKQFIARFEEFGLQHSLADLSTGEKQVVFRGMFLLSRGSELAGAVVLIDEPELSLHPRWQERIVKFYDEIVGEARDSSSQIVIATHSPFIVHGSPASKHVILRRNDVTGRIFVDPQPTYPGVTASNIAVAAFSLDSFVKQARGERLALVLEGPTDVCHIELAWRALRPGHPMPFSRHFGGSARGVHQLLGYEAGSRGLLVDALANTGTDRALGLFDFDNEGLGQWNGTVKRNDAAQQELDEFRGCWRKRAAALVWVSLIPVPAFRSSLASMSIGSRSMLTIELLYPDAFVGPLLDRIQVPGGYIPGATSATKGKIVEAAKDFPALAFSGFAPIFALIDKILAFPGEGSISISESGRDRPPAPPG